MPFIIPKTDIMKRISDKPLTDEELISLSEGADVDIGNKQYQPEPTYSPEPVQPKKTFGQKALGVYEQFGLPALAVAETILSEGKSPGTTAMAQQEILANRRKQINDSKALQMKEQQEAIKQSRLDAENARKAAMQEKLFGFRKTEFEAGQTEKANKEARAKAMQEKLQGLRNDISSIPDEEGKKKKILDTMIELSDNPQDLALYLKTLNPGKSFEEQMSETLTLLGKQLAIKETFQERAEKRRDELADKNRKDKAAEKEETINKTISKQLSIMRVLGENMPPQGRITGNIEKAAGYFGFNEDVEIYNDMATSFVGVLAKKFGGDIGTLSDTDKKLMMNMYFKPSDTKAERSIKNNVWEVLSDPEITNFEEIRDLLVKNSIILNKSKGDNKAPVNNSQTDKIIGKIYTDDQGNSAIYKGNGQWEEVQ